MTRVGTGSEAPDDAAAIVRMLQFGDSMLPVGSFAFSGGLESAIQKGVVTGPETLLAYTRTAVEQAARGDGIALLHAHRAAALRDLDRVAGIDALVYARKLSAETRAMTVRIGRKYAALGVDVIGGPLLQAWLERVESGATPGCYPMAVAVNFAAQGLPERAAFVVHQHGVAAMILGAALRLMKVGHVDTQRMLYRLNAEVSAAYETAAAAALEDMASFAPLAEVLAAVHVKAHVRLFMN
jgi:urease accessory protein